MIKKVFIYGFFLAVILVACSDQMENITEMMNGNEIEEEPTIIVEVPLPDYEDKYKFELAKKITSVHLSCVEGKNDTLTYYIEPLTEDGNVSPVEFNFTSKVHRQAHIDFALVRVKRHDVLHITKGEFVGDERFDNFVNQTGYFMEVPWSEIDEYPEGAPDKSLIALTINVEGTKFRYLGGDIYEDPCFIR